jgi:hypothetical protein
MEGNIMTLSTLAAGIAIISFAALVAITDEEPNKEEVFEES